jgi:hypothetical protein
MSTDTCLSALKTTLNEIRNVCPQVSNTFIFGKEKNLIARDEGTDKINIASVIKSFDALNEKSIKAGGIESVTFQGTKKQITITRVNNFYFAAVSSRETDEKTLKLVTRVLVPTVLKAVETIQPEIVNAQAERTEPSVSNGIFGEKVGETEKLRAYFVEKASATASTEAEPYLPEPPISQFLVENLSGGFGNLLNSADAVRVDSAVIARWKSLYGDRKIEEVQVEEAHNGKRLRCKFRPIKEQKFNGKGIIQIPEKMQTTLQTKKGALVMVKPIIE